MQYSVVIPVYNSESSLEELSNRIRIVLEQEGADSFEVIFIDDYSVNPRTWPILKRLAREQPYVRALRLTRNYGQAGALMCGLKRARGLWVFTMDDDLQHRPEDMPLLMAQRKHDVVIGRFEEKETSWLRQVGSKLKGRMDRSLLGMPRDVESSPFKLIKRRVIEDMLEVQTARPFILALILDATSDVVNVTLEHGVRKHGSSNYTILKLAKLFYSVVFGHSAVVLRLISLVGVSFALISVVGGVGIVIRKLLNPEISPGWTSTLAMILFSTGAILFCLGVVGEYIFRLQEVAQRRPAFRIRDEINHPDPEGR